MKREKEGIRKKILLENEQAHTVTTITMPNSGAMRREKAKSSLTLFPV
jgi:hypothetical protein